MKRMKVVITGADGFLGYRLSKFFKKDYEVYAMNHHYLDITNGKQVDMELKNIKPDIVIHCAAISNLSICDQKPEYAYDVNVNGTINIAKACKEADAKLIFCSTDQIYRENTELGNHCETEKVSVKTNYAKYKYEAEYAALSISPNAVCLRLPVMYDTSFDTSREHFNLMAYIIRDIKEHNQMFYSKNEYRGFTCVNDIIRNLPKTFDLPGGVYNYGCENNLNTYELMKKLMRAANQDESLIQEKEQNMMNLCMDTSKAGKYGIEFQDTYTSLLTELKKVL